jgi:Holliday junction DNA helicase RuvA
MIAYLKGEIAEVEQDHCVVETGGVGYLVYCTQLTIDRLRSSRPSEQVRIHIKTIHRDDTFDLYGFMRRDERVFFELLLTVSGVGPKQALRIMGTGETGKIMGAVVAGDSDFLRSIAGIGEKKARQIILELQEKLKKSFDGEQAAVTTGGQGEALEALLSLGFTEPEAREALDRAAREAGPEPELSDLVEGALRHLSM